MIIVYTLLFVLWGVCILGLIACAVLAVRNQRVYKFRISLIDQIGEAGREDINAGEFANDWRWDEFDSVDYNTMVVKFWKPLTIEEWYGNDNLITPRGK